MTRIYVDEIDTDSDDYSTYNLDREQPRRRAGFFNEKSGEYWHGNKEVYDGANRADVNTRDHRRGEGLYRTAQGRWVLRTWSNWVGESDTYAYISDGDARDWLIFNDYDDDARKHFGPVEQERGPARGRPEIGGMVSLRLGDSLPILDTWRAEHGLSRAEAVRGLIHEHLG